MMFGLYKESSFLRSGPFFLLVEVIIGSSGGGDSEELPESEATDFPLSENNNRKFYKHTRTPSEATN